MGLPNNILQGSNRILADGNNMIQTATATGGGDHNGGGDNGEWHGGDTEWRRH